MNLQQLSTFCTVLSEGSMTAAADKLYLTQPAVSQQIRSLEDEVGVTLLVRGVRQVKPTMQGQLLYDYAKRILHLTHQAEVSIQTMSQELSGRVSLGTSNSIGLFLVSPIIGMFLKHNNRLAIKLAYDSFDKTLEDLKRGKIDMAILPDLKSEFSIELPDFDHRFILKDEMWLVASGRDTSVPASIELKDYSSRSVVAFSEMYPAFTKLLNNKLRELKLDVSPVFETENVGTIKRVIESGLGWGFLPAHSIRKQVRTRRMTWVQVPELNYSVQINLYFRKGGSAEKMAEVFHRALQQQVISG